MHHDWLANKSCVGFVALHMKEDLLKNMLNKPNCHKQSTEHLLHLHNQ